MRSTVRLGSLCASASLLAVISCVSPADDASDDDWSSTADVDLSPGMPKSPGASQVSTPVDIQVALAALEDAEILDAAADGIPRHLRGTLGRVDSPLSASAAQTDLQVRAAVEPALAAFRLQPDALTLRKMNHGSDGRRHLRYAQRHQGLDVIGGDLVVSIDSKGTIYAIDGTARGDFPANAGQAAISKQAATAAVAQDARFHGMQHSVGRQVFIREKDTLAKAYEVEVTGTRGGDPVRDLVYVDVDSGHLVAVHPQIHSAKNRATHDVNNTTSLPGSLVRSEAMPAVGEIDIDSAHANAGITYDAYHLFWNRDSYDGAGGLLRSTVHYSSGYCNAFWNGTQMVYGDGSGPTCLPLARAIDVAAHELTHAVTSSESQLDYAGESGGINESLSDAFGAFTEAYEDGGYTGSLVVNSNTFLIAEDVMPPFLRNMCDPAADGYSKDYWYAGVGNVDVHYSSGVANLMFCLLAKGGTHPRGKSNIVVPGIGLDKAIRINYYAAVNLLTSSSDYAAYRTAMMDAAAALHGQASPERNAVDKAFQAVGVAPPAPDPSTVTLSNGVPVHDLSGATGSESYFKIDVPAGMASLKITIADGTGDADLYVKLGAPPTTSSYSCRPYLSGNNEQCSIAAPAAGTWYIMVRGSASFSGVTLTATRWALLDDTPVLVNDVAVTNISGTQGSQQYWKINVRAGNTLTFAMSGGTPDADLYIRESSKPTTSTYLCRPYSTGNNETCTVTLTKPATYYVMIRGYTDFSGVSLKATY